MEKDKMAETEQKTQPEPQLIMHWKAIFEKIDTMK